MFYGSQSHPIACKHALYNFLTLTSSYLVFYALSTLMLFFPFLLVLPAFVRYTKYAMYEKYLGKTLWKGNYRLCG